MVTKHLHRATQSLKRLFRNRNDRQWHEQLEKQAQLVGTTQKGMIVLGDISGYTQLVTQLELDHARQIIFRLFDRIYEATGQDFIVNEIEGDAIFAYTVNPPDPGKLIAATIAQIKDYGHAFYHARQDLDAERAAAAKACTCTACSTVDRLSFKFILHYGDFAFNQIGPFVKLVGASVVLAHRLLKNGVPGKSYVLMTKETLDLMPEAGRSPFVPMTERIENFGDVAVGYRLFNWEDEDRKHHQ